MLLELFVVLCFCKVTGFSVAIKTFLLNQLLLKLH